MWNNPYVDGGKWDEDGHVRAVLALAYEQHVRNKIAYLTLTHREWYDGDDELDDYFGE